MSFLKKSIINNPKSKSSTNDKQGSRTDCSAYLRFIPIIEHLIAEGMLKVDLREIHVSVDYRIHLGFLDEDKKYLAFFDKIRAYMNYKRGLLQVKKFIEPEERINFIVFRKKTVYTLNGVEASLVEIADASSLEKIGEEEKTETLLVGYATEKVIDYVPLEK